MTAPKRIDLAAISAATARALEEATPFQVAHLEVSLDEDADGRRTVEVRASIDISARRRSGAQAEAAIADTMPPPGEHFTGSSTAETAPDE